MEERTGRDSVREHMGTCLRRRHARSRQETAGISTAAGRDTHWQGLRQQAAYRVKDALHGTGQQSHVGRAPCMEEAHGRLRHPALATVEARRQPPHGKVPAERTAVRGLGACVA